MTKQVMLAGRPVPTATAQEWVTIEEYAAVCAERDAADARIAELEAEVAALHAKLAEAATAAD